MANQAFNKAIDDLVAVAIAAERARIMDELFTASQPVGFSERTVSYYRANEIVNDLKNRSGS